MIENVYITEAVTEDAEAILSLQRLAYQREAQRHNDFTIPPLRETLEEWLDCFKRMIVLKAIREGEIIGSVRAEVIEGTCYIGRLIVHPECERRGIGSSLMQAIEASFPEAARFELFTGHLSEGNLRLYHRLGYTDFATREVTPGLSLVYLEKHRI